MELIDLLSISLAILSIVISCFLAILGYRYSERGNTSLAKIEQRIDSFTSFLDREMKQSREDYREDRRIVNDTILEALLHMIRSDGETSNNSGANYNTQRDIEKSILELRQSLSRGKRSSQRKKVGE